MLRLYKLVLLLFCVVVMEKNKKKFNKNKQRLLFVVEQVIISNFENSWILVGVPFFKRYIAHNTSHEYCKSAFHRSIPLTATATGHGPTTCAALKYLYSYPLASGYRGSEKKTLKRDNTIIQVFLFLLFRLSPWGMNLRNMRYTSTSTTSGYR